VLLWLGDKAKDGRKRPCQNARLAPRQGVKRGDPTCKAYLGDLIAVQKIK